MANPKDVLDSFPVNSAPGYLIRRAQQRAVDLFVEEVGEDGPTPRQFAILMNVYRAPGMTQTALVQASGIDRSTLTEILRRMIDRGLISRTRQEADQRANVLMITPAGEEILGHAVDAVLRSQVRIMEPVPPEHRNTARQILAALAGYAEWPSNEDVVTRPDATSPCDPK